MKISEWERSYCELLEWEKAEDRTGDGRMRVGGLDVNSRGQGEEFCHPSSRNRKWVKTSLPTFWPLQITFPPSPIPAAVWSPPSLPGSFSPTCFLYVSPTPWISTARWLLFLLTDHQKQHCQSGSQTDSFQTSLVWKHVIHTVETIITFLSAWW